MSVAERSGLGVRYSFAILLVGSAFYPKQYGVILIVVGVLGVLLLKGDLQNIAWKRPVSVLPYILAAFLGLSAFWSSDFRFSAASAVVYVAMLFGADLVARKLKWLTIFRSVALSLRLLIVFSWTLFALGDRSSFTVSKDNVFSLNGAFVHSNLFATVCVLAFATSVCEWRKGYVTAKVGLFWSASSVLTLWLTDSRTGFVVALSIVTAAALLIVFVRSRMSPGTLSLLSMGALCGTVWLVLQTPLSEVSLALGRSSDLTGRTDIWSSVLSEVGEGSGIGTGFMAAWRSNNIPTQRIWQSIGFPAAHAHNGYLDVLLQLGFVGAFLVVAILVLVVYRSVFLFSRTRDYVYLWTFSVAIFQLVYNVTETRVTFALAWTIMLVAYFRLASDKLGESDRVHPTEVDGVSEVRIQ